MLIISIIKSSFSIQGSPIEFSISSLDLRLVEITVVWRCGVSLLLQTVLQSLRKFKVSIEQISFVLFISTSYILIIFKILHLFLVNLTFASIINLLFSFLDLGLRSFFLLNFGLFNFFEFLFFNLFCFTFFVVIFFTILPVFKIKY